MGCLFHGFLNVGTRRSYWKLLSMPTNLYMHYTSLTQALVGMGGSFT